MGITRVLNGYRDARRRPFSELFNVAASRPAKSPRSAAYSRARRGRASSGRARPLRSVLFFVLHVVMAVGVGGVDGGVAERGIDRHRRLLAQFLDLVLEVVRGLLQFVERRFVGLVV